MLLPTRATSPISLQLVMVDGRQALETGGLVKIITEESAVGPEDCLGDWRTSDSCITTMTAMPPPGKAGCWKKPTAAGPDPLGRRHPPAQSGNHQGHQLRARMAVHLVRHVRRHGMGDSLPVRGASW